MSARPPNRPPHRRFAAQSEGVAALEFALIAPVFLLLMIAALDFGHAFYRKIRLINATTAAAHYALRQGPGVTRAQVSAFQAKVASIVVDAASLPVAPVVTVLFNNAADSGNLETFYCLSGYPAVWAAMGAAPGACGGNVSSGRFVTISVNAEAASFFLPNAVFGTAFDTRDDVIVRIQ